VPAGRSDATRTLRGRQAGPGRAHPRLAVRVLPATPHMQILERPELAAAPDAFLPASAERSQSKRG